MKQRVDIQTQAGHSLVAHTFSSQPEANQRGDSKGVCIIAPATGVAQYLYDDFAHWLSQQGFNVITFDYDGMGLSIGRHVKDSSSDKLSWAKYDCPAVIQFARQHYPQQPLIWIGHSVGGHMLGMMENCHTDLLEKAITVASGTGTWWYNAAPTKRVAWFLWYVLVPVLVPIFGYFPGNKIKIMCDMPKGVIMQWRRWCLHKDYAIGKEGDWLRQRFAGVKTPITAMSFSDDDMMSPKNIQRLHHSFSQAPQTHIHIRPQDVEQKAIRHIGWHKERYRQLWERYFAPVLSADNTHH